MKAETSGTDLDLAKVGSCRAGQSLRQIGWKGDLNAGVRHDAAGVLLLGVLDDHTRNRRHQVGAYYQGLGAVSEHGLYGETQAYVANVLAIQERLEAGRPPA